MTEGTAWVISANMGLGHQRATYPLRKISNNGIQVFGEDKFASKKEKTLWKMFKLIYETLSRTQQMPVFGPHIYNILEKLQNISPYYPSKDRSAPTFQVKLLNTLIKMGFGKSLCEYISTRNLPVITSFYAAAIACEKLTTLPVYCIICDADINRVWVAEKPQESRIEYFVPCRKAMRRLIQYGVPSHRIHLTGFPLPYENIGKDMSILRSDLSKRLINLDPYHNFRVIHAKEIRHYLGNEYTEIMPKKPLTLSYAVGGAGAQKEIGAKILKSLKSLLKSGDIYVNLIAGIRNDVYSYFTEIIKSLDLENCKNVRIIYNMDMEKYFREFSQILRTTDILWTKPSEVSFYCGLGIPIIISPPIGPHEIGNKDWLTEIGAGIPQEDPAYCSEWIKDYLYDGIFAQSAWNGFLNAHKNGVMKIQEIIRENTPFVSETSPLLF